MEIPWTITEEERLLAEECLGYAMKAGASGARVTMNKNMMDLFSMLNGELDKVTRSGDRSIMLCVFADGKYGTFSTNRLGEEELKDFAEKAVATVRLLEEDPCRKLPDPLRCAKGALTGLEMGLYDPEYAGMDAFKRLDLARRACYFGDAKAEGVEVISEECEYSDSVSDEYLIDSNGLSCRDIESSFEIGTEYTIQGADGRKYSAYWWDSSTALKDLGLATCGRRAFERALSTVGPAPIKKGRYNLVLSNEVSGRVLSPVLNALKGTALQQKNSFMLDSLGKKIFPSGLNIYDKPCEVGRLGSKLYDSEGVAQRERAIVKDGKVETYFINTYMAGKMGMAPTIESDQRPCVEPFGPAEARDEKSIMELCGDGILVCGFNGGNNNSSTGDFSYGIEGFHFKDGKIVKPVEGVVMTGNFLRLWNNLIASGRDSRPCRARQVPTLAFKDVDFSA